MAEILGDTVIDSVKIVPFLFLTYFLMELLEHKTGERASSRIKHAGMLGPVWGGLLGIVPQCGFSTAASSLYAGRVVSLGTLMAVYLSTSDEMLPVMISQAVPLSVMGKALAAKAVIAILSGLVIEWVYGHLRKQQESEMDAPAIIEDRHCSCEGGILKSAVKHTAIILFYIFIISLLLNIVIGMIGEEALKQLFVHMPVAGEMIAACVGLIPNCASSVVITELYLEHIIGAGEMMAGLLVNAGVGILVLLRLNKNQKQNARIIGVLYGIGVFWGVVIDALGITF